MSRLAKIDESIFRVLQEQDASVLVIDCVKQTMPRWMDAETFYGSEEASETELHAHTSTTLRDDLNMVEEGICSTRYTIIADILPYIGDQAQRNTAIAKAATDNKLTGKTIRNMLCKYLAYQDKRIFAPPAPAHTELSTDEKNMRWALNKFYYTRNGKTLSDTYTQLIKHKYCDESGKVLADHPSLGQFAYYYRKTKKVQTYIISRDGIKNYQKDSRPLLGEGVQQFAPAVGTGMADSTVCDIYLCDDSGKQLVGRPILTAIVDAYSGLCYGYTLGWSNSVQSLRELLLNCLSDKVELCRSFGIDIKQADWNCQALPAKLITDRGGEYASYGLEQLTELGITITNLPSFRAELKGPVERFFALIQGYYKNSLRGKGVIEKDVGIRGAHDYRKDACLSLREFEKIILQCIVYYNRERLLAKFPYTQEMLNAKVPPHPSDIWNYGLDKPGANLIAVSKQRLITVLLPRTKGRFTQRGLIANKIRYKCDDYTEEFLTGESVTVAYNPDDVTHVYLIRDDYRKFDLIESRFEGLPLEAAKHMMQQQIDLLREYEPQNLQAKVNLARHIQSIVDSGRKDSTDMDTKNVSRARSNERYSKHRNLMEVVNNDGN